MPGASLLVARGSVLNLPAVGCRAEEEEGRPGPAGECQQECQQEGEQGGGHRLSETQGTTTAATARDSGATHICRAYLGTFFSLQAHAERMMEALLNWSPGSTCTHTLHTYMDTQTHTQTPSPNIRSTYMQMCVHTCACTHVRPPEKTSVPQTSRCE